MADLTFLITRNGVRPMIVGAPKEIKRDEYRVSLLPVGVEELTRAGHRVLVESGAGLGSGITDQEYAKSGAEMVGTAKEVFHRSDMIIKVKEPQPTEVTMIRRGQIMFTYFHLAADKSLTESLAASGVDRRGLRDPQRRPRPAAAVDADERSRRADEHSRRGQVSGTPADGPRHSAGRRARRRARQHHDPRRRRGRGECRAIAAGFRANVALLDINMDRLRYLDEIMPPNVTVLFSDRHTVREQLRLADLVIGAVLVPGAKAPCLIEREDLKVMKPGSVIIDVAVDQGGCVATTKPTTHSDPTYVVDDVLHYCVANMPGAVGRTSTFALCNVTLPWALQIANRGIQAAASTLPPVARAINVYEGEVTNRAVAETFGMKFSSRFEKN